METAADAENTVAEALKLAHLVDEATNAGCKCLTG